jgi:hypothetical protein
MRRVLVTVITLSVSSGNLLHATTIVPAEFREVVSGSQMIVHGRVLEVRPVLVDGRRRIDTIVTLEVGTVLKGGSAETVTFRVPGGTVGRYRSIMVGAPQFQAGEEVVMFLRADGPAIPHVFGLSQGVFRVRTDQRTGQRVVIPPVLTAGTDAPQAVTRGAPDRRPVPLEDFGAQVRAVLRAGAR